MRISAIASHPIQYQVPIFRALASRPGVGLRVHFGRLPDDATQGEGFGVAFRWDVPLLDGYEYDVFAAGLESLANAPAVIAAASRLRSTWRRSEPDVVLHLGWHHPSMFAALGASLSLRLPRMLRCEANLLAPREVLQRVWHRWILRRFAAFLPVGKANAAYYDAFGPRGTPRFFSPLFAGGESMQAAASALNAGRAGIRRNWGLSEDGFCFLFAGKFEPKKRPEDVVRALSLAEKSGPPAQLLFVGSGDLAPRLKALSETLHSRVAFAGFLNQSEMPSAYAAADCLVLPSDAGEVWGLVVNEAMACGLPAIVSDQVGCAADLVEPGETGMVFRCGDVEGLADCLRRMAADPAGAARMGARAKERVAGYSAEIAAEGILQAARAVTQRGGGRG